MKAAQTLRSLKNPLWALLFALVLWKMVDGNVRQTLHDVPVRLEVEVPSDYRVTFAGSGAQPPPVTVSVTGPQQALERLPTASLLEGQRRDVPRAAVAARFSRYRSSVPEDIEGESLPVALEDFELVLPPEVGVVSGSFQPSSVRVILDKVGRAELAVEPVLAELPEGWEVRPGSVTVAPTFVVATGPERRIAPRPALKTTPIELGARLRRMNWDPKSPRPFVLSGIATPLVPPEGSGIEPVEETVRVTVTVSPVLVEVELQDVRPAIAIELHEPWTDCRLVPKPGLDYVSVRLRGPKTLLQDEKAVRRSLRVFAVLTRQSMLEKPLEKGQLRDLSIEVYPPEGVEWLRPVERLRFQVEVEGPAGAETPR